MPAKDIHDELTLLIQSRYQLLVLDTREPEQVDALLMRIASDLSLPFFTWSRSRGLRRVVAQPAGAEPDTLEPSAALEHANQDPVGIFHFRDLGAHLGDALVVSQVLDLVGQFAHRRGALVLTGQDLQLPDTLRAQAMVLRVPPPTYDDYRRLLERLVRDYQPRINLRVDLRPEDRTRLLNNLAGLSLLEAEKVLTRVMVEDATLDVRDVAHVLEAKRQLVEQDGMLEYYPAVEGLAQVAGLAGLKAWLGRRRAVVSDPARAESAGVSFPKGVLLLGVPGCGKSLCARAVANEWGLPLLKLDAGNLFNKYVGETEKNLKRAMQTAERMAPIVLWIDELEKAFASVSGDSDGGVAQRIFGSFLTWLQDRKGHVFVVATSNDVSKLPPEFIRKGRFDEIFFVDLPTAPVREDIYRIHLAKRGQDLGVFDLAELARRTDGFSGAEIETSIVSAMYAAFAEGRALATADLLTEAAHTRPLARIMSERLSALRQWATQRTVNAD